MATEVAQSNEIDGIVKAGDATNGQETVNKSNEIKTKSTQETQPKADKNEEDEEEDTKNVSKDDIDGTVAADNVTNGQNNADGTIVPKDINIEPEEPQLSSEEIEHTNQLEAVMQSLYYVYFNHEITGPFKQEDILTLYITSKIDKEIWVRRADMIHEKWFHIDLQAGIEDSKTSKNEMETEYNDKFSKLLDYLLPKLKLEAMKRIQAPLNIPRGARKKFSIGRKIIKWIGWILLIAATLIVGVHTLFIGVSILAGLYLCPGKVMNAFGKCLSGGLFHPGIMKLIFVGIILPNIGLIVIPFFVVFFVLLGEINDDYWNGEIQSWMIGYIAWGIFSFLLMLPLPLRIILDDCMSQKTSDRLRNTFLDAQFWVLGVSFGKITTSELMKGSKTLGLMFFFIFPASAAVLPSVIIGFIANFALEEKFELKCNNEIANVGTNLCSDDLSGCCEIISSYDVSNTYSFVGGLASNILATWAVIRICGYLLVAASDKASVFAKRNK